MRKYSNFIILPLIVLVFVIFTTGVLSGPKKDETKNQGYLGVYLSELDQDLKDYLDYKGDGAFVDDVQGDTPAEQAGIEAGDIIVQVGDTKVKDTKELRNTIRAINPGEKVKIYLVRDGKKKAVTAKIGSREKFEDKIIILDKDDDFNFFGFEAPHFIKGPHHFKYKCCDDRGYLGIRMDDMTEGLREYFGVEAGALITEVIDDTPAEKAGLKAGDVIIEFNGKEVEEQDDVFYYIGKTEPGDEIEIKVSRKGKIVDLKAVLDKLPKSKMYNKSMKKYMKNLDKMDFNMKDLEIELEKLEDKLGDLENIDIYIEKDLKNLERFGEPAD